MEFHRGRLIDHVHLRCRDLAASQRFYRAVLDALGIPVLSESGGHLAADELWLDAADVDGPASRVHLAFQCPDRATVWRVHAAALAAGGTDNGEPGIRELYHP
ncbi:MAG TPA: VOC family protein, partial [Candidatus Limnocylindria bacterium]|nr:VOC family protein [Candidatus Limnocylindria bacterium]